MPTRIVVGCMSGTSMDAIDAALVRIEGAGLSMRATPMRFSSSPLGGLSARLRAAASQARMTTGEIAALSREFSIAHVGVIREAAGGESVDLVAVHGQSVFHAPPVSWQLLTQAVIAHEIRTALVFALRAADLVAGGQGAPITPLADCVLFRSSTESRVILNLGGFANFTYLPNASEPDTKELVSKIRGGDICACNQLLDGLAARLLNRPFDREGAAAAAGTANQTLMAELLASLAKGESGRSLGTAEEPQQLISRIVECWSNKLGVNDILASAVEAIAKVIARALPPCERVLVAGGGARNLALLGRLRSHSSMPVDDTDACGIAAQQREAIAMAILGALCQDRVPITLPQITGVADPAPIAGAWILPNSRGV